MRHEALARARRSQAMQSPSRNRGRRIAVTAVAALVMGIGLQLSPYGYHPGSYRTDIAEQRVIPLEDNSSIALDGATALRVQFNNDARTVELVDGQAQFSVAYDPARPFKVHAGELTVVALGTIFTVEQVAGRTRVILIEGRVAVLPDTRRASRLNALLDKPTPAASTDPAAYASGTMELGVGDELRLDRDGRANVTKVDLDSATAWRRGKLVFHDIPLDEAVSRMNRHSRLQIRMEDPELAALPVSGVFQAGDAGAFAHALESYLPLSADYSDSGKVSLHRDSVRKP
ncbi:MAG: FecR family protein [Lysobacter sp.]